MIEQCKLQNKTLIFESAANKSFNLQKGIINSFVEHSIIDGVDCILVREETNNESFVETISIIKSCIMNMEPSIDNKLKHQELSK
jgi:hypothetical protein